MIGKNITVTVVVVVHISLSIYIYIYIYIVYIYINPSLYKKKISAFCVLPSSIFAYLHRLIQTLEYYKIVFFMKNYTAD